MENKKYDGWLISDSFMKRTWAVFGYGLVGSLIFWLTAYILFYILDEVFYILG